MSNLAELKLSHIRTDGGTQPRSELNQEIIEEYAGAMAARAVFPPVTVFYDRTHYWLADGFHRVEAAKKIGSSSIRADVKQGTLRQAVLHSLGVNARHGLRRSNEDKRRAVQTLLHDPEWSQWSDREIARHAGVSDRLVNNLSKELTPNRSQSNRHKGADGRIINTINIGKRTRGLVGTNQAESSPQETGAEPVEKDFSSPFASHDPQRQLPPAITIDVKAEVIEDDEESSAPTEIPPASAPRPQPESLIKPPAELEPPEATDPEPVPELEQAQKDPSEQEATTLPELYEVGDRIHIEGSQNKHYNGKTANVVRVNSRHKTLTVLVNGAPPWNTVSLPMQQCARIEGQTKPLEATPGMPDQRYPTVPPERHEVGDRIRILRRQHGEDNWAGKAARIWEITSDGCLRVDVEGHPGVRFTLKPDWVERMPEEIHEQSDEQPEPELVQSQDDAKNGPVNPEKRVRVTLTLDGEQVEVEGTVTHVKVDWQRGVLSGNVQVLASEVSFLD